MGRTEQPINKPANSTTRTARAKRAKETINKTIPALLSAYPRARQGIERTELFKADSERKDGRFLLLENLIIRVVNLDTITAVSQMRGESTSVVGDKKRRSRPRTALLNMASPLRPGGGFLTGASSQEEFLCMRTTLLPSLREEFYRLPEVSAVYTPDVLVFRDENGNDIPKSDRFFVDVISAAMLRFPDIVNAEQDHVTKGSSSGGGIKHAVYANDKDRAMALAKMRVVLDICAEKQVDRVVLGAWGCGAFGNPVHEVAQLWRKALYPSRRKVKESREMGGDSKVSNLKEVVFAITDRKMADAFRDCFEDILTRNTKEEAPLSLQGSMAEDGNIEEDNAVSKFEADTLRESS
ncbi:MAG: hypothetical protein Q9225_004071 [Loekoesia sp. 1 TL-2023]